MSAYTIPAAWITAALYLLSSALYVAGRKWEKALRAATITAVAGILCNTAAYLMRAALLQRMPLESSADFLLLFAWFILLFYLVYELKSRHKSAGSLVLLFGAAFILIAVVFHGGQLSQAKPVIPELKSALLSVHVVTCAIAYASFAVGAGLAAIQLKKGSTAQAGLWVFRISALGYVMLTLGIVLGAVWAEQAWGRFWSWDPKEIWALVTWIIYAIYFHKRKSWDAKKSNLMVILGFGLAIFTFLGVNYLFSGLHSYA